MSTRLEILENALEKMREDHRGAWEMYGGELCAGDMFRKEEELEKKIAKLKSEMNRDEPHHVEDPRQIVDN